MIGFESIGYSSVVGGSTTIATPRRGPVFALVSSQTADR
jgi:hypothetical protein